jgi:phosphatidylglycerophosphate synthase
MSSPRLNLAQLYRATLKAQDLAFNVYVCRPLAAVFVYALRDTRVAPNQVTFFSLLVAAMAALCFVAVPWPLGLWIGVAVYELSYVFDKVDGMLARARGVQSPTGHLLDFLMDEIKAFFILAAVAAGAYRSSGDVGTLLWGLGGVVCLASGIGMTTFLRRPEVLAAAGQRAVAEEDDGSPAVVIPAALSSAAVSAQPASALRSAVRLAERVGRFFIHYPSYIWLAAVLTDVRLYLYPYVVVNVLYCARSLLGLMLRYGGPVPIPSASADPAKMR